MNNHESTTGRLNMRHLPLMPREHGNLLVNYAEPTGEESQLSMADAAAGTWVTVTATITRIGDEAIDELHLAELMGDDKRLGFALVTSRYGTPPTERRISFQGQIQDVPAFHRVIEVTAWQEVSS